MTENKSSFCITVDTETFLANGKLLPFEDNIYGRFMGDEFGVGKIMDICDRYGAKATFFVDVYMHYSYGEKPIAELCEYIAKRGHDVQLHAHTGWLPNSCSSFISAFSTERQAEIIFEGKKLINKWIGKEPIAFRAGAYAANLCTIKALEINEFIIDSSYFPLNRNCQLNKELNNCPSNSIFLIGKIYEIPVTTYWLIYFFRKNSKIDINACSLIELKKVIPAFVEYGFQYTILFLHSFSFIKWNRNFLKYTPDYKTLKKFNTVMELITNTYKLSFISMEPISKIIKDDNAFQLDFTPFLHPAYMIPRILQRL